MLIDPHIRREYRSGELTEDTAASNPLELFGQWFQEMLPLRHREWNAFALATASPDGRPSVRMVLLKDWDEEGLVFYTNYESRKGAELEVNPRAAALFYWETQERQVRVEGAVTKVSREQARQYFATRPEGSRLGAWASRQSQPIPGREALSAALAAARERFSTAIPLPDFWGGYRISWERIEFWQGRENRLHDRLLYTRTPDGWLRTRLSP